MAPGIQGGEEEIVVVTVATLSGRRTCTCMDLSAQVQWQCMSI